MKSNHELISFEEKGINSLYTCHLKQTFSCHRDMLMTMKLLKSNLNSAPATGSAEFCHHIWSTCE